MSKKMETTTATFSSNYWHVLKYISLFAIFKDIPLFHMVIYLKTFSLLSTYTQIYTYSMYICLLFLQSTKSEAVRKFNKQSSNNEQISEMIQ